MRVCCTDLLKNVSLADSLSFLVGLRRLGASLVSTKPMEINLRNPTSACSVLVTKAANRVLALSIQILYLDNNLRGSI